VVETRLTLSLLKVLLYVTLTVGSTLSFAQQNLADLEQKLSEAPSDSVRFLLLVQLAESYERLDFEKATKFTNQALELAEANDWNWAKIEAYERAGFLGTLSGDYSRAIKYDNDRLQLILLSGDSTLLPRAVNIIGNDYSDLGQYDKAYQYFTRSYRLAKTLNDSMTMSIAIHNIGNVFKELGQYEIALSHFEFGRKISKEINDLEAEAYTDEEEGDLFMRMGQYEKAETYLLRALRGARMQQIGFIEPRVQSKLASLYQLQGLNDIALLYYDSATALYQKTSNVLGLANTYLGKGKVFIAQKKFREAEQLFEMSLATAERLNAQKLEIECYLQLSSLAEQEGNPSEALRYFKNYHAVRDSLFSEDMEQQLFRDQLQFETEGKDQEIAQLNLLKAEREDEIRRQELIQNILVVAIALTGILMFTIYRSGQRRIRINKLLMEHQEEIKKRSVELEQLNQVKDKFFSIISHDLRSPMNALAAILTMLDNNQIKPEEFTRLTKELKVQFNHTRSLINNLLDWALLQMEKLKIIPEKIDLRVMAQTNFSLLSSMHTKDIRMENHIREETIGWADLNMINLVFRNLILNAIKFTDAGGLITISAQDLGAFYEIAINDNGVGIKPEVQKLLFEKTSGYSTRGTANEKGTGLGLILCKEFVEKNGGSIRLESEEGKGSTFFFTVHKAKNS
jgi:signal transduction histidine kinase